MRSILKWQFALNSRESDGTVIKLSLFISLIHFQPMITRSRVMISKANLLVYPRVGSSRFHLYLHYGTVIELFIHRTQLFFCCLSNFFFTFLFSDCQKKTSFMFWIKFQKYRDIARTLSISPVLNPVR